MSATFDDVIQVSISLDAPPVPPAGFGTLLIAGTSMLPGFVERLRLYASAAEASADPDLGASLKAAVASAFAQSDKVQAVAVGRIDALAAESQTVSVVAEGDDGDQLSVTVLGQTVQHIKTVGQSPADVVDALIALLTPLALPIALVDLGGNFSVTHNDPGVPLGLSVSTTGTAELSAIQTQAPVSVGDELDAVLVEGAAWYGLALESRAKALNLQAATWAEANARLFIAQSSDAGILDGADAEDLASMLQAASRARSGVLYHHDDLEWAAVAWLANRLSIDPDAQTTIWSYVTLSGVTPSPLTSTQKAALLAKNANAYLTLGGQGATGKGTLAVGRKIDLQLTADWLRVRSTEAFQAILLNYSARGQKVPYTDAGFAVFEAAALGVLARGVGAGHFVDGSARVNVPKLATLDALTRASRTLSFTMGAEPAGAVEGVVVSGYVSLELDLAI